jgi:hypothetical protein
MAYISIATSDIAVDKPITNELMTQVKDNLDYLYGAIGINVGEIANGSFEVDSDADGTPDNWTLSLYAAGAGSVSTNTPGHGEKCFIFTRTSGAGNGGGQLLSDYIAVSTVAAPWVSFALKQSSAQPRTKVLVRPYTAQKATLADSTIYDSTANPTAWTDNHYRITLPTSACFVKIALQGGTTDHNFAGTIAFDNIRIGEQNPTEHIKTVNITQAELKTSTGSVSQGQGGWGNQSLPGGEYGFYPQTQGNSSASLTAQICKMITGGRSAYIYLEVAGGSGDEFGYAYQRYVTSSGEIFWIFICKDKNTKQIKNTYFAPDHPCFGGGGDPLSKPHPFPDYNPDIEEIIVINLSQEDAKELRYKKWQEKKPAQEIFLRDYEIVEKETEWPSIPITVGLSDYPDPYNPEQQKTVQVIKKIIPKPDYIKCFAYKKR